MGNLYYDNESLAGKFANRLRNLLEHKKFKGLIVDDFEVDEYLQGIWDFHYKGMNFIVEWWYDYPLSKNRIEAVFSCKSVDTEDGEIDVTSYDYRLDENIGEIASKTLISAEIDLDNYIHELESMIQDCYIAKNVNSIYKKVEKLYNDIENMQGCGNKDVLVDILRRFDLIN